MKAFNHNLKIFMVINADGEYFDTWHDTFTINGASLFSNVFMLKSIECMSNINKALSKPYILNTMDAIIKKSFNNKFWNGKFLKIYPHMNYLETVENALAILFDIVDREKASSILIHMENNNKKQMLPVVLPELLNIFLNLFIL